MHPCLKGAVNEIVTSIHSTCNVIILSLFTEKVFVYMYMYTIFLYSKDQN